ncbi:PKD domain-containing protein [Candidatus Venteria ishoeyi]|nr:PKD domain-containing protein [Candidatus Venteria ishoeyi]
MKMYYKYLFYNAFLISALCFTAVVNAAPVAQHPALDPPTIEVPPQPYEAPVYLPQRRAATTEWTYHRSADGAHPDGNEQAMLWLKNIARQNPAAEGIWLATSTESDIASSRNYFSVNTSLLQSEFASYQAEPPAAFDVRLYQAAYNHSLDLIARDAQDHNQQFDRISAQGFVFANAGGSVFSYANNALHAHAGFNIDWGGNDGSGMQTGRGHRVNLMSINKDFSNVGIAMVPENNSSTSVGPLVVTENYAHAAPWTAEPGHHNRFLVGTVWEDKNTNSRYDAGEGYANVRVEPNQGEYFAITSAGGGYAIPITAAGTYQVTFSGGVLTAPVSQSIPVADKSVLLDYQLTGSTNANQKPSALFDYNVQSLTVTLDASASFDADGVITQYQWSTNNGLSASGKQTSLTFSANGDYIITLTVTDDKGEVVSVSKTVSLAVGVQKPGLSSPLNHATKQSQQINFSWQNNNNAVAAVYFTLAETDADQSAQSIPIRACEHVALASNTQTYASSSCVDSLKPGQWYRWFISLTLTDSSQLESETFYFQTALPTSGDDAYETNNTPDTAYDLSSHAKTLLSTIQGYGIQADEDWYKFFVPAGTEKITVDLSFTHADGDIDILLFDESGNFMSISEGYNDSESIEYTVARTDIYYYVMVYFNNAGNTYDLRWDAIISGTAMNPSITDISATPIGVDSVSIKASVTANGQETTVFLDYGLNTTYENRVNLGSIGSSSQATLVKAALSDLNCGTLYHFRVAASTNNTTVNSDDQTFATGTCTGTSTPTSNIVISDVSSSQIDSDNAKVQAKITPDTQAAVIAVEYGTSTQYGQRLEMGSISEERLLQSTLQDLQCNTTYHYRFTAQDSVGLAASDDASLTTSACPVSANPPRLTNISTRAFVAPGQDSAIAGFIIKGTGSKTVLLRAAGQSLRPVVDTMLDPKFNIHDMVLASGQTQIAENDDWQSASRANEIPAAMQPGHRFDSALLLDLAASSSGHAYTAVMSPLDVSGVGLISLDAIASDTTATAALVNISTRAYVGLGQDSEIAGFIIQGEGKMKILIKALGRSMNALGVNTQLDPIITLHDMNLPAGSTQIYSNDNWASDVNAGAIPAVYQPTDSTESAILIELDASMAGNAYTAVVTATDGKPGVGLISVDVME